MEDRSESTESISEVRIYKPKAILLDFHGTLSPVDWEEECILPYIKENIGIYLSNNWNESIIANTVEKLRQQSFEEHYVLENEDVPIVEPEDSNDTELKKSVKDFIIWQLDSNKSSADSLMIQKLVWVEGYDKKVLKTPVFEDVLPALKFYKQNDIKTCLFSNVDSSLCRKLFSSTKAGDLTEYFHHFYDTDIGSNKDPESYKSIAQDLGFAADEILFITDYGQEARIANQTGVKCLLMIRPKNRPIRKYYLIKFSSIQTLDQIKFVDKKSV